MAHARGPRDIELEGMTADEAFAVLGDEVRLDIIRVLWRAHAHHEYEEIDESVRTLSFSALQDRVDVEDNGRFNYHLSRLVPHFVVRSDDGYRLTGAGTGIARTVIAISGDPVVPSPDALEIDCPLCGGQVVATYEDQWFRVTCTDCEGLFGDTAPSGTVFNAAFTPTGLTNRTAEEALTAGLYRCVMDLSYMMAGVCPECTGQISGSVEVERDRGDSSDVESDDREFDVWGALRCRSCRFAKRLPIEFCVAGLAPVMWFLESQDIHVTPPTLEALVPILTNRIETSVLESPRRIRVDIDGPDDAISVTLAEDLTVFEITT